MVFLIADVNHIKFNKKNKERNKKNMRAKEKPNATVIHAQDNKVTFVVLKNECIDVEIDDGVGKLILDIPEVTSVSIKKSKSYPGVKEINIGKSIRNIYLSNKTFPNVRKITSDSRYFKSGKMLVRRNPNSKALKDDIVLENTFCLGPDEVVDLSGITMIKEKAFSGCKSVSAINTEDVRHIDSDAFTGSRFDCAHIKPVNGVAIAGSIIVDADKHADEYVIPEYITATKQCINFNTNASMTVNNMKIFFRDIFTLYGWNFLPKKIILNGNEYVSPAVIVSLAKLPFLKELEISEDNTEYMTKDNILYTKDGTKLLKYIGNREDNVRIIDGVKEIQERAFYECDNIKSITMPDTVECIGYEAFYGCHRMESVNLSKTLKVMESSCFAGCYKLSEIEVPATLKSLSKKSFSYCTNLKNVKLHNGLEQIHTCAFESTQINELNIPESVNYLSVNSLIPIKDITINSNKIPENLIFAIAMGVSANTSLSSICPIQINVQNEIYILPAGIKPSDKKYLNDIVSHDGIMVLTDSYEYGASAVIKQEAAFYEYDIHRTPKSKAYVSRNGKKLAERMVKQKDQESIIKLIRFGILSRASLNHIYDIIPDDMPEAKAYILNDTNGKKKVRFSL